MHTLRIPVAIAALCAGVLASGPFAPGALVQGGRRQWYVHLRDGRVVEANPLGAPDDNHLATHVLSDADPDKGIPRSRIDDIAPRVRHDGLLDVGKRDLPAAPTGRVTRDVVVRTDGRRTAGRVTLKHVEWSEGVVVQNGVEIDLADVAYIKFARPKGRHPSGRPSAAPGAENRMPVPASH